MLPRDFTSEWLIFSFRFPGKPMEQWKQQDLSLKWLVQLYLIDSCHDCQYGVQVHRSEGYFCRQLCKYEGPKCSSQDSDSSSLFSRAMPCGGTNRVPDKWPWSVFISKEIYVDGINGMLQKQKQKKPPNNSVCNIFWEEWTDPAVCYFFLL